MSQRNRKKDKVDEEDSELNRDEVVAETSDARSFQDSILRLIEAQSLQYQKEREHREREQARMEEMLLLLQREKVEAEKHRQEEEAQREKLRLEAEIKLQTLRIEELRFQEKQRQEERLAENRRRDTPKMSRMTTDSDIDEYFQLFEVYVGDIKLEKQYWMSYLRPLLNDRCRTAFMAMEVDERGDYDLVKEHILNQCGTKQECLGSQYWSLRRKKGQMFGDYRQVIVRLLTRLTKDHTTKREVLDVFTREKLLQSLPPVVATQIRDRAPKTADDVIRLADTFFMNCNSSPDDPRWQKKQSRWGPDKRESFGKKEHSDDTQSRKNDQKSDRDDGRVDAQREKGPVKFVDKIRKCFECGEAGHIASRCPTRVNLVLSQVRKRDDTFVISGKLAGKEYNDLLVDTGADMTVVKAETVPETAYTGKTITARGFGGGITHCNTARMRL